MKLQKRVERLEDTEPHQEPCKMTFKDSKGMYRVHTSNGTERLSEPEFNRYNQDNRTIVMEPIQ